MKKRLCSFVLIVAMLISLFPTAAFAAGGDYEVDIVASKFNTVEYNEKDTMKLDFTIKTNEEAQISGIQTALLVVDTSKYDILGLYKGVPYDYTATVCPSNGDVGSSKDVIYSYYEIGTPPNISSIDANIAGKIINGKAMLSMNPNAETNSFSFDTNTSLMSILLGLKDGVDWEDLTSDGIRFATAAEAKDFNATGTVTINGADGDSYVYLSANGESDTLIVQPKLITDDSFKFADEEEEGNQPVNTEYQVYYQIEGTDTEPKDKFVEIDPGSTFEVGVYVKSTGTDTKKMQAFDIYPTWDPMLSYVSVSEANAGDIVVDEMENTVPHFYSVAKDLNKVVTTEGVKIATLKLKLSENAVFEAHYPVSLSTKTNMAVELDAESVPVTVDTTEKGAETLKKVTVTFDTNGGNPDSVIKEIGYNKTVSKPETNPTKAGYTFAGWYDEDDKEFNFSTALKEDTTVYAKWNAAGVEVTLNANGGKFTGDKDSITVTETYGNNYSKIFETTPIRDGYEFAGWFDATTGGTEIESETKVSKSQAHPLYAHWNAVEYTIKFDTDGGASIEDMNYTIESDKTLPVATKTGYTFDGWVVDGHDTNDNWTESSYSGSASVKGLFGNITLKAQWSNKNYTITSKDVTVDRQSANYKEEVTVTVNVPEGYEINKVTFTPEGGSAQEIIVSETQDKIYTGTFLMPDANVTVNATFTAIDYSVEVGTLSNGTVTIGGQTQISNTHINDIIALTVTPANGYKVKDNSVKYIDTATGAVIGTAAKAQDGTYTFTMPATNVTVSAEFEAQQYTVTLNANDGKFTGNKDSITVTETYNSVYSKIFKPENTPTRDGYTFAGWYDDKGNMITEDDTMNTVGGQTLFAQWTANTYTITFVTNGGSFEANSGVIEKDGKYTMTYTFADSNAKLPVITKELQEFTGWTVSYADDATEKGWGTEGSVLEVGNEDILIGNFYGDVILTANWDVEFTYAVEDYKYAPAGYVMLRIATDNNTNSYVFGSGESAIQMYYTEDDNYKLNGKAVFVTLIPETSNVDKSVATNNSFALTLEGMDKINQTTTAAEIITRDGKINKDSVVNIADANAIYQMTQGSEGAYYTLEQLGIKNRLEADMDTNLEGTTEFKRGSIADVHAIVNIINDDAQSTTN